MWIRGGSWVQAVVDSLVRGKYVPSLRFASIGAGTSGTVTLPANSTVILDGFGGTVDAIVCQISGGKPTASPAFTATGAVVAATFNSSGDWTLSGAPVSYPVAIVYQVKQTIADATLDDADIWMYGEVPTNINVTQFGISIDGDGLPITTGVKGYIRIPYACKITGWTLLGDVSGSMVIDVWKDTYANYPPTVADTIAGTEKPTISTATKGQDVSLSTWTLDVAAGDVIGFNVDSCSTITKATLTIDAVKT